MPPEHPVKSRGGLIAVAFVGPIALILGVLLGGWQARGEVEELQQKLKAAEERERSHMGAELVRAMWERPPPRHSPPPASSPEPQAPAEPVERPEAPELSPEPKPPPLRPRERDTQAARDLLRLRQRQALNAFEEQARPDRAQRQAFDDLVIDMNDQLRGVLDDAALLLEGGGEPERRDMMILAVDLLEVLIEADDRLHAVLEPSQRDQLDPELLDPLSYLDESVLDALSGL